MDPLPTRDKNNEAIRDCCERYLAQRRSGTCEAIEEYLSKWSGRIETAKLVVHLVKCEIEFRRARGESPSVDEYATRFTEISREQLEDLLDLPAAPPPRSDSPALPPRYEVLSEVGRGGIGSVWRIRDRHLDRPLAVKVLLPRFRGNAAANARLDREAMITGSLQHPQVPPVHDRGQLESGSVYFTMKLVDGQTLAEMLSGRESNTSDVARFLGIFEKTCQTVAFAHARGVIHRDLKPHNIMIGRFGEVQVMDWGMARHLDNAHGNMLGRQASPGSVASSAQPCDGTTVARSNDSSYRDPGRSLTQHGDVFGTPAYMPPEQALGNLDAMSERSDVFSLGAILFEILTATRLYDEVPRAELEVAIQRCDLSGTLSRLDLADADAELKQLCRQCLASNPEDRPGHAGVVASAVSDYLNSADARLRQAELDRAAAEARAQAEIRRRRAVLISTVLIGFVSLAGLAAVSWQWRQTAKANQVAQLESARASVNFQRLMDAVDRMLTRVGDEKLDQLPHMKTVRRELLHDALAFYEDILSQQSESVDVQFEVAEAHRRVGNIEYLLGEYASAIEHFQSAVQVLAEPGEPTHGEMQLTSATLQEMLARSHERLGRLKEAQPHWTQAVRLRRDLVSARPDDVSRVIQLADSLRGSAKLRKNLTDLDGAQTQLNEAVGLLQILLVDDDQNREQWLALAACYQGLGSVADRRGDAATAEEFYGLAVEAMTALPTAQTDRDEATKAELSRYLNNLAISQRQLAKSASAEKTHQRALALRAELVRDFPNTPEYRQMLAASHTNLGVIYKRDGRTDLARQAYGQAISELTKLTTTYPDVPKYRDTLVVNLHNVANLLEATERNEQAIAFRLRALEAIDVLVDDFPDVARYRLVRGVVNNDLALQLERRGRTVQAIDAINAAIADRQSLVNRSPGNRAYAGGLAVSQGLKAWILAMAPDPDLRDAEQALELARLAIRVEPDARENIRSLGAAAFRAGNFGEAIDALVKSTRNQTDDEAVCYLLAMSYWNQGEQITARKWLQDAERLYGKNSGRADVNIEPLRQEAMALISVDQ